MFSEIQCRKLDPAENCENPLNFSSNHPTTMKHGRLDRGYVSKFKSPLCRGLGWCNLDVSIFVSDMLVFRILYKRSTRLLHCKFHNREQKRTVSNSNRNQITSIIKTIENTLNRRGSQGNDIGFQRPRVDPSPSLAGRIQNSTLPLFLEQLQSFFAQKQRFSTSAKTLKFIKTHRNPRRRSIFLQNPPLKKAVGNEKSRSGTWKIMGCYILQFRYYLHLYFFFTPDKPGVSISRTSLESANHAILHLGAVYLGGSHAPLGTVEMDNRPTLTVAHKGALGDWRFRLPAPRQPIVPPTWLWE